MVAGACGKKRKKERKLCVDVRRRKIYKAKIAKHIKVTSTLLFVFTTILGRGCKVYT